MTCTNCGAQLPEDAGFCAHCGTQVENQPTEEQAPLQPEQAAEQKKPTGTVFIVLGILGLLFGLFCIFSDLFQSLGGAMQQGYPFGQYYINPFGEGDYRYLITPRIFYLLEYLLCIVSGIFLIVAGTSFRSEKEGRTPATIGGILQIIALILGVLSAIAFIVFFAAWQGNPINWLETLLSFWLEVFLLVSVIVVFANRGEEIKENKEDQENEEEKENELSGGGSRL